MGIVKQQPREYLRIGAHMSVAGGLDLAIDRALECGFNCLQIFTHSPRVWAARTVSGTEIRAFKRKRNSCGIKPVIVHAPYLPNLASPDEALWQRSMQVIITDYALASSLGADYYVIHPGSTKGLDTAFGVKRVATAVSMILDTVSSRTVFLLETTAGGGSSIGSTFTELADIIAEVRSRVSKARLGICLDSAHVFAAGFDIRRKEGIKSCIHALQDSTSMRAVKVIHANDSKTECASHHDQHDHIGKGKIGPRGFRNLMKIAWFRKIPWILETPKEPEGSDIKNRKTLQRIFRTA